MTKTSQFRNLAESENFWLWTDRDDDHWINDDGGIITLSLANRGVLVHLSEDELNELVGAVTQAQAEFRRIGLEGLL